MFAAILFTTADLILNFSPYRDTRDSHDVIELDDNFLNNYTQHLFTDLEPKIKYLSLKVVLLRQFLNKNVLSAGQNILHSSIYTL